MRWSQLKQRVEANFAPRVRGDITFIQAEAAAYQPDRASMIEFRRTAEGLAQT